MDRLTCIVCRPTPSGLSHTQCHHACTLADDPLCRWDCTSHVNPPTYTATWGRANAPASSGDIITEPALLFTATYSLYVHIIAASNFRVTVNGQIASPSDITLLSDPSTPTTELVIGVALDSSLVRESWVASLNTCEAHPCLCCCAGGVIRRGH